MALAIARTSLPSSSGLFEKMPAEAEYINNLTVRVGHELDARSRDDSARSNLMLRSPGGAVWAIYVDDAGVLTTARVSAGG
jgi:hypothetical protein